MFRDLKEFYLLVIVQFKSEILATGYLGREAGSVTRVLSS